MLGGIRRNAIALLALFVALGGTAVAVDKIGSNDIAGNAVRSKHIKDGQVKTGETDLVKYRNATATVTTTSDTPADLGPSLTVQAKGGSIIHVHAAATITRITGLSNSTCYVKLGVQGPGEFDSFILKSTSTTPVTVYMDATNEGTTNLSTLIGREIPVPAAGEYTLSLRYQTDSVECDFANRRLWVEVVR